jgi:hypothetical protein
MIFHCPYILIYYEHSMVMSDTFINQDNFNEDMLNTKKEN